MYGGISIDNTFIALASASDGSSGNKLGIPSLLINLPFLSRYNSSLLAK